MRVQVDSDPSDIDHDHDLYNCINEVKIVYGDNVSVGEKAKSLLKFGRNENVTNATTTTLMILPSDISSETYASTNAIDSISSASTSDTTQTITIEGHTISGTNLTFSTQTISLNGRTRVALTTPLARSTRAYVSSGSNNLVGPVYIYENSAITNGVPDASAKVHLMIAAGKNQSEKASTSLSCVDYWFVTQFYIGILEKTSVYVSADLEVRSVGSVFRHVASLPCASGSNEKLVFDPPLIIPKNSDIRLQLTGSTTGIEVAGFKVIWQLLPRKDFQMETQKAHAPKAWEVLRKCRKLYST